MELDATSFWILIVALEVFMLNSLDVLVTSASPKGFVSINCGGPGGWDPITTLDWESDRKYLQAADQLAKLGIIVSANVTLAPSTTPVDNAERLETALVFYPGTPGARLPGSKYCYNLSVEYNSTGSKNYLLRATFPSRNLKARDINGELISFSAYATRFYFSVDSTYISTVDLDELHPQTIELIIPSFDTNVYVCLVPLEDRSSMPAISALELRPLSDGMYASSSNVRTTVRTAYLITISRLNFGGDPELPSLRYPSDKYDRLWSSPPIPSFQSADVKVVTNTSYVNASNPIITADVDPPEAVMSTAWEGRSLESNVTFQWNLTEPRPQRPMLTFHANILWYDILDTSNATRFIDVYCGEGKGSMTWTWILDWEINEFWGHLWIRNWFATRDILSCTVSNNGSSDLPAMINMAEIYGELNSVVGRTRKDDAVAVGEFALEFPDHLDGSGDPCLPVPWDWIVCSIEVPPRVTQINLTSKDIGGNLPTAFGKLKRLTVLDLSNNNFRGSVPSSLVDISALRVLNVERNELTGELPIFTSQSLQNLEFLSLSSNRLSGNLTSLVSALGDTLSVLDVSNNSFTGNIPPTERLTNLQNLDLSNNQLYGEVGLNLVRLKNLRTLNLNNNHLGGRVPDNLWSASNLVEANLNGNMFTEIDLTTWYKSVLEERSFNAEKSRRKVRLVGNQIHTVIIPSLPPLETKITSPPTEDEQKETLENPAAFILLAGNPWCEGRGEPNISLLERYLCRSDERQNFWSPPSGGQGLSRTTVIIVILICALVVALVLCVSAFLLRRMGRRNRELHQIQEALAKEHVKPPFFNYDDLRSATQNFSSNKILGRGGFGTVYKADLADGSILAVKKLNPTEQNTSDFLKEMVNISGIKHRHLIQLKGCCVREKKQRMLVYEYAENRSLAEALWGPGSLSLSWKQRFNICLGIARGLAYLHDELQPKMVHRDIKPQNILLDKDYNAKIADFGLVRPAEADNRTQITLNIGGTRGYGSPEYLSEGVISEKLDVFSYGIVLLEIVSGRVCIDYNLQGQQIVLRTWAMELYEENKLLSMVDMKLTGEYSEEEILLILRTALACCQFNSKNRPTMSQVVNLLMKQQADVALDIVTELKRPLVENTLDDETEVHAYGPNHSNDAEDLCLIFMNASEVIELSDTRPR